ncbi:MAG: ATP-binding protein [bacterium]
MLYLKDFLASVHYLNHPLLSGLGTLFTLLLGIFVITKNNKSELYRAFFGMTFVISIWFFGNALSMFYSNNFELAVFWYRFGYTGVCFMAAIYYHLYLIYTKKKENIIYFLYFIAIFELLYLWFSDSVKMGSYVLPNVGVVWRGEKSPFFYFLVFGVVKYLIVASVTALSFLKESKRETGLNKERAKWLAVIFFAATLGGIEWLVAFDIPLHIGWIAIPLFISAAAYAIIKHQLMDIRIVIKKAFIYSVVIGLISGGVMGISFLNSWFIKNVPGFQFWTVPLITAVFSFIIGNIFWRKSKEADKLKYEFITIAAHKLRTPLTKIKWAAKELSEEIKIGENKNLISQIMRSNEQLIELTDILLNTSKTEEKYNKYMYELTPVSLEEITKKILLDAEDQIKLKDIKIISNFKKNLAKVNVDKERINSVIQILLENAIVYSIKGGEIKISLGEDKNNLVFSVKDNGVGIPKKDQPYIFFKFFRADNVKTIETEGSGLGLVLAKNIVERHGGKIGFESKGENKGTKFWFSLPLV